MKERLPLKHLKGVIENIATWQGEPFLASRPSNLDSSARPAPGIILNPSESGISATKPYFFFSGGFGFSLISIVIGGE